MQDERYSIVECILFVTGDPIPIVQLQASLDMTAIEMRSVLEGMEKLYREEHRGIQLYMTGDTVQLVSNKEYAPQVEHLLQPVQNRSFSQSMLETLSIIAYRQPVTRAEIEAVRGVRCDYSVTQLLKAGMIREAGQRDCLGRPMTFATTDGFLRHFGLHSLEELPKLDMEDAEQIPLVEV